MTAIEIYEYISKNDHNSLGKFTRITLRSGKIFIGHFSAQYQNEELMNQNKWVLIQGGSNDIININGNDIKSIKEN